MPRRGYDGSAPFAACRRGAAGNNAGMDLPRRGPLALALAALAAAAAPAAADPGMCRVINLDFTPSGIAAGTRVPPGGGAALASPELAPQIVAWIEKSTGEYVDTVFITEQTGRYGLGNRPGRYDFNSALRWPYGRRITTFPVWAHRHGKTFTQLEFQSGQDSDLSHRFDQSSRELHYCRPIATTEKPMWDAVSCASTVYTDKGVFGATPSLYPPRVDITATPGTDSGSVAMFKAMNPFDAVSQATPAINQAAQVSWPIPYTLPMGSYVMVMEVSLEQDFNAVYSVDAFPAPIGIPYGTYGVPYRGQPSEIGRAHV